MEALNSDSGELIQEYVDFLDDANDQEVYDRKVKEMVSEGAVRLKVNINHLRNKNNKRALMLLKEGGDELQWFEKALKTMVDQTDSAYSKLHPQFFIGLEGSFGARHMTPRTLSSSFLGNIVCVEGIVSKCSLIRPKVAHSVHYCPSTHKTLERSYNDATLSNALPTSGVYPTKDDDGNLLETEYGLSLYRDHQTFSIQEMPEKSPTGQLPRSVEVICDDDLIDLCKPGDRIQVVAVFTCLPSKKNGFTSGTFRTVLVANNIVLINKESQPSFSVKDIAQIKKFTKQKHDVFEVLAQSLAPTIHGHDEIKRALLCMLLGGVERVLDNGTRIRGDINLLLIGDPSMAKSQLLRYVQHIAPRCITTTGRGSSGVGLTAAVTTDHETGERRLEAGAMVLGDRGVVCIDEFDKMSDMDRTAIHEVMEQGKVTIAKAGIHAKLNARCSVLAAANPVYGRYNQYKTPMENIGLQDSLLSRFDLLFIVLDMNDPEKDRSISEHILKIHQYRCPNQQDGEALPMSTSLDLLATQDQSSQEGAEEMQEVPIYEQFPALNFNGTKGTKLVSLPFIQKFLHVAKELKPRMSKEAADFIAQEYSKLRNLDISQDNVAKTQPVTPRSLETMIRLASSHAKCRMAKVVEVKDAKAALALIHFAYFKKVMKKEKKRRMEKESDEDEEDDGGAVENGTQNSTQNGTQQSTRASGRTKKSKMSDSVNMEEEEDENGGDDDDPYSFNNLDKQPSSQPPQSSEASTSAIQAPPPSDDVQSQIKSLIFKKFHSEHAQTVGVEDMLTYIHTQNSSISAPHVHFMLQHMHTLNQVMLHDNIIYLI